MLTQRNVESLVGLFLLGALLALMVLATKVSGLTSFFQEPNYMVTAQFDDIGSLKVRAPVKIGGVLIGEVASITLDPTSFRAVVSMRINKKFNDIPDDSSASILTAGLLGDNYIALAPQYSPTFLKQGSEILDTHPAVILEKLIGQLMFKLGGNSSSPANATANTNSANTSTGNTSVKATVESTPTVQSVVTPVAPVSPTKNTVSPKEVIKGDIK